MHIDTKIKCVKKELKRRKKFYPLLVENGKLSQEDSDNEIQAMTCVLETLSQLKSIVVN